MEYTNKNNNNNNINNNNNNDNDDVDKMLLSGINEKNLERSIDNLTNQQIRETIHDIYITTCVLIIFISLYLLNKYSFISSILIVFGILLFQITYL